MKPTRKGVLFEHAVRNVGLSVWGGSIIAAGFLAFIMASKALDPKTNSLGFVWSLLGHPVLATVAAIALWIGTIRTREHAMVREGYLFKAWWYGWENLPAIPGSCFVGYYFLRVFGLAMDVVHRALS